MRDLEIRPYSHVDLPAVLDFAGRSLPFPQHGTLTPGR